MKKMLKKKKIIALVLIAAMALASAATVFADTVVTTTIATPLYKYATVADGEYATIPQGTALTVISSSGVFYYVQYSGNYGYILQSACNGTGAGTSTNVSYYLTTNAITYLYYSANTSGGSYGTIQSGQSVGIISTVGSFYYVNYGGHYGYVQTSAFNSSTTPTNSPGTATVTYSTPFYVSASTSGGFYGTLDSGDVITTYSVSGSFTYGYIQGKYGYVLTAALSTNSNGASFYATTNAYAPMYSSASTSSTMTATVPSGVSLNITSTTGGFYYTQYNGYYGYVPTSYFNGTTTNNGSYTFYVTTNSTAGLYSSASTSASIYTTIASGTRIGVISTSGSFYYTLYNGYYGYVLTSSCNSSGTNVNTSVQYYLNTLYSTPLYSSANTSSVSYSTITAGTSVGVISKTFDGFYYVYVNGNYGYIPQAALNSTTTNTISTGNNAGIATYGTVAMGSTLYASDSTTGTALGRVSNSGTVSIISQTTTGFYYVKVGNYTGYLQIAAVTVANDATVIPITDDRTYVPTTIPLVNTTVTTTGVTTKKTGTIENCVSWVCLREDADSSSDRLAKVTKGSTVEILGTERSYTKVVYAGNTGFILSSYVA